VCGSREIKSKARQQQDVSRIGNKTDAHRVLAEKDEAGGGGGVFGDSFGDYFGNPGLDGRMKMDVGEIQCAAAEWI